MWNLSEWPQLSILNFTLLISTHLQNFYLNHSHMYVWQFLWGVMGFTCVSSAQSDSLPLWA